MNILRANRLCQAYFGDDADRQAVIGVRARVAVLHEQVAPLQITLQPAEQLAEFLRADRAVIFAPPDMILGVGFAHDEFILRGAGGMFAGIHHQRPHAGDRASLRNTISSYKRFGGQIPVALAQIGQAMIDQPVFRLQGVRPDLRRAF